MDWVSRVARGAHGRLQLEVATRNGTIARDLTRLRPKLDIHAPVHRNLRLQLADLQRRPASDFLTRLGQAQHSARAQSVFEVQVDGIRVCIPAQLLIVACFGSHQVLRESLFSPCGLQHLTDLDSDGQSSEGLTRKVQWILRNTTARASWASVYRRALDGHFDLQLPNALAELSVWGCVNGDTFFVTQVQLVAVTPTEAASAHKGSCLRLIFDRTAGPRAHPVRPRPSPCDDRVPSLVPERRLSDSQWARVQPVLAEALGRDKERRRGAKPKHGLRDLIDVMLLKLSAPRPWREISGDRKLVQRAAALLPELRSRGIWDRVLAALAD